MCIAVPMEIIAVDRENNTALARYAGNTMKIDVTLIEPAPGDYVLIHAGCAIEILDKSAAVEILSLYAEIEETVG